MPKISLTAARVQDETNKKDDLEDGNSEQTSDEFVQVVARYKDQCCDAYFCLDLFIYSNVF